MGVKERKIRQFALREDEIISAAYELFCFQHPAEVTIEQIAQKCEIGRGTLYLHFKSKDDIYAKIIVRRNRNLLQTFANVDPEQMALDLLEQTVDGYINYCLEDPEGYRIQKQCDQLLIKENLKPDILAELEELRSKRIHLLSQAIQKGIDQELLPPFEPILLLSAAWGMLYGAIDIILQGHFANEVKDRKQYLDLIRQSFQRAFLSEHLEKPNKRSRK